MLFFVLKHFIHHYKLVVNLIIFKFKIVRLDSCTELVLFGPVSKTETSLKGDSRVIYPLIGYGLGVPNESKLEN